MTEATLDLLVERALLDPGDGALARALVRMAAASSGVERPPVRAGEAPAEERAALALALAHAALTEGNVRFDLRSTPGRCFAEAEDSDLADLVFPEATEWAAALRSSPAFQVEAVEAIEVEDGDSDTPCVAPAVLRGGCFVSLARWARAERRIARAVRARLEGAASAAGAEVVEAGLGRCFPEADTNPGERGQREAVRRLLVGSFGVLTGGPGTGKTTTVAALLALQVEAWRAERGPGAPAPLIRLAAPTGKAAARLGESMGRGLERLALPAVIASCLPTEAATLHRLLGARGDGSFRHGTDDPLLVDLLVVDEASMVDLLLMERVFAALPAKARLLLVGDRDQLASVESGAVLRDLCAVAEKPASALAERVATLEHSWRYRPDSGLDRLARAARAGDANGFFAVLEAGGEHADVRWIEAQGPPRASSALADVLRRGLGRAIVGDTPRERLEALARFQVLCARRTGPEGAEGLNAWCRRLAGGPRSEERGERHAGRPVIVTRNDRALGLSNGDVGVLWGEEEALRVWFEDLQADGGVRSLVPGRLPEHEDAYALTVHKSQGSEYEEVCVILPSRASPLLVRELLYTGVTRARERLVLFGPRAAIERALAETPRREGGLAELLGAAGGAEGA